MVSLPLSLSVCVCARVCVFAYVCVRVGGQVHAREGAIFE